MDRRGAALLLVACAFAGAQAANPPRRSAAGDHALQRAAWFMRFRQSRDAELPAAHLLQAWRQVRRMSVIRPQPRRSQRGALTQLGGNWTELGPRPESDPSYGAVAGRMTAIAVDTGKDPSGNTVYLGAADGGLWMSTNALSASPAFTPIDGNLPTLAIGAIALDDSTTPTTIYAGTGEANGSQDSYYGLGIYKSSDGGQTWTTGTGVDFFGSAIVKLLVDPTAPNILLAAVTEGGVYVNNNLVNSTPAIGVVRSADGGATWSQVAAFNGHTATDLIYDSGKYYVAIRSQGIYVSSDQGQTWQALGAPFGAQVAVSSQNFYRVSLAVRAGAIFALIADNSGTPTLPSDCNGALTCTGLVESLDGGNTWTAVGLPANLYGSNKQGAYDQFLAAPANTSLLVIGGIDAWSESLSPQASGWTNLTNAYGSGTVHADQHAIAVLGPQTWIVANDGGAWSTAAGGAGWTDMNASIGAIQFYSVSPSPSTAGRLLGGSQDNGTVLSAPGNLGWPSIFGGDGGHTAINPQNQQQLFTENYNVSTECSSDGGATFQPVVDTGKITENTEFYVPYVLAPSDPTTMLLAGSSVWRGPSCPGAVNSGWQAISPALIHPNNANLTAKNDDLTAIAAAPSSPDVIYAGAFDGSLSVTFNATVTGALPTWTEAPAASPAAFAGPVTAIAVDPTNPRTVYWGMGFVGSSASLYKSTDGGQTAVNVAGNLPGTPIDAIVLDPANPANVFVATDVGVFVVSDGGSAGANETWFRVGSNLPAAAVLSLALTDASGTPALIAGTHGRGAWSIPAVAPPGIALTAVPAQVVYLPGEPVTLNLAASGANGFQGSISLACGSPLPAGASCAINGTQALVTGIAQAGIVQVPIVATGNDNGTTLTQIADAGINEGDFTLTASPTTTTISAGGTAIYHVTIGGTAGLNFPAAVTCTGGPPAPGSCSVPSTITAAPGGGFDVTVTAAPAVGASGGGSDAAGGRLAAWLLLLLAAGLAAVPRRRARWAAVALLALACAGCGSQATQCPSCGNQNYSVTITLKDATPSTVSPVSHSVIVGLTVI